MKTIPKDKGFDSSLGLLFDGYDFISKRCKRYQSNIFQTRLMLEKTICFKGEEAAKVFYDKTKFTRENAAPDRVKKTLFGEKSIQGMDGDAHLHRKQMFMSLMSEEGIQELATLTQQQWHNYGKKWENMDKIVLFDEAREVLCRAACAWVGVPLEESEVKLRSEQFEAMIAGSGVVGPKHWQGRKARQKNEKWIETIIENVRNHQLNVPETSPIYIFANHRDLSGKLLDKRVVAVELINVLRPIVAIDRYITFGALALHEHPECRPKLLESDDYLQAFVEEIRRFYPFFPFAAARVRQDFDWQGYHFPQGTRVLLDLYGTNRDPQSWDKHDVFDPERFLNFSELDSFKFIPQGGGDYHTNHRCPGEWITIELLKVTMRFLIESINYNVPEQDLRINHLRMPTIPASGFVIDKVKVCY
ncbi:cytochrome P450 [Cyanothece sp. BG0011]|uniref:cytochrome P450 n=1 Tax=Cyanothece sp. BG0011 TaxID=2082950 RepID=UPI000D1EE913|nr:cytochrome P450 [Cyanothece sp. BG0011]